MRHLKRFEELDLDKYKNFLDKYQKTGYISTTSIKKLKEWGLDIKDFSHIENQVVRSLDFFRSGDKDLFFDYFMDIKDKYPYISTYFYYSLDVYPKSAVKWSTSLDKFNIVVSMDDNNLPSNVRLLCPNCHSQTITYKSRNKNSSRAKYRRNYYHKIT
jgi:hypothetical protein